jgi:WD40 repeat protein
MAVTPDVQQLVSGSSDNTIKVWELESGQMLRSLEGHTESVTSVAVTPDGQHVVSGSGDNTVKVWELESGQMLRSLEGHTESVTSVAVTPDGQHAVSGSKDKTLKVWELVTGNSSVLLSNDSSILSLALSHDGHWLVCGDAVGRVWIFEWVDAALGAPIITPWKNLSPKWIFWNRKESMAFGCPFCKVWSPISESALGAYLPCPACGETVRFTSFTIEANWRPMAGI